MEFLKSYQSREGRAPSVQEIMEHCHTTSSSSVQYHLKGLESEGSLRIIPRISRGIQLLGKAKTDDLMEIPLLGTIAAGEPIPVLGSDSWTAAPEEMLEIPPSLVDSRKVLYALRVKGTSMIDALIGDGDLIIMEATSTAENGDMVAVWIKSREEVTLKKIYRERDRIRLQPANPLMSPIFVDPDDIEVQGKVHLVIRQPGR